MENEFYQGGTFPDHTTTTDPPGNVGQGVADSAMKFLTRILLFLLGIDSKPDPYPFGKCEVCGRALLKEQAPYGLCDWCRKPE